MNTSFLNVILYITCTRNNIFATATNSNGDVLATCSSRTVGFRASARTTRTAALTAVNKMLTIFKSWKISNLNVYFKGHETYMASILKFIKKSSIGLRVVKDTTLISHNGCRLRAKKRK